APPCSGARADPRERDYLRSQESTFYHQKSSIRHNGNVLDWHRLPRSTSCRSERRSPPYGVLPSPSWDRTTDPQTCLASQGSIFCRRGTSSPRSRTFEGNASCPWDSTPPRATYALGTRVRPYHPATGTRHRL